MYDRIIKLIGEENLEKIKSKKILLVGVGGVGSFTFISLIRSGFQNITIIDKDKVELSNLNRQLIATLNTIGQNKVDVAKNMATELNNNIKVKSLNMFLDKDSISNLDNDYDYIIDACDTINTKLELIKFAQNKQIKIISSMGVGNRVDATKIKLARLDKTNNDPLAKKLRKLVKDNNLNNKIPVVYSEEIPKQKSVVISSLITTPGVAGLFITNYIINDILGLIN